jgi:hypothetical protein
MSKLIAGRTYPVVFDEWTIELRVLSGELADRLNQITKEFAANPSTELRDEAYAITVASWPWEGSLRSVLTDRECWQLVAKAIEGASLTADERKKFVSLPTSEQELSANETKNACLNVPTVTEQAASTVTTDITSSTEAA